MRRMEHSNEEGIREYPGIQPTKLTRMTGEDEGKWPTYRFGQEGNDRDRS